MICPTCRTKLRKFIQAFGVIHACPTCNGRAVGLAVIRKIVPAAVAKDLWKKTLSATTTSRIPCPSCNRKMANAFVTIKDGTENLDICRSCHFIWFDPQEFESLPKEPPPTPKKGELPAEAKKMMAVAKLDAIRREHESEEMGLSHPDHWWEYILGLLGMPVEYKRADSQKLPIATLSIAALMVLATGLSYFNPETAISAWGLVPNQLTRHFGLTFISSFLLHGGIVHLICNLYFLLVFGDNVEETLERKYYLLLIGLSALAGDLAHIIADPGASVPLVGASGGISGVLTYYCFRFPRAQLGFLFMFQWFRIPAGLMLVLWVLGQVLGAYRQVAGFTNVSALAHLGGALVGFIFWLQFKRQPLSEETEYPIQ